MKHKTTERESAHPFEDSLSYVSPIPAVSSNVYKGPIMAEMRRLTLTEALILLAILVLAAGTRAGYLMACADSGRNAGPLLVESLPANLDMLVRNLKDQQRFAVHNALNGKDEDTAWVAPGYPVLMAVVGYVSGDDGLPSAMRWLQCGLGVLTAGLYFLFARRVFRNTLVAALAGLLGALQPFWILDTAALADGVVAMFLLALVLFLGVRADQTGSPFSSLLYGLALAALALVRAALLPFAFVALAWFLLRCRALKHGWLCGLLGFLGFVNGLAPWVFRNWQLYGEPVPIVNSTYYHLWVGNKPPTPRISVKDVSADPEAVVWPTLDNHYAQEIWREISEHPADTVRRRLRAGLDFLFGERWFTEGRLADRTASDGAMPDWLARSYPVVLESTLLGLIALALLGWRWTYAWRRSAMPLTLALFWIPLPYVLSHAEALSGPRLPLDGVLLCYAAFALACLFPARRQLWAGEEASGAEPASLV
jgi:4-amino-4-deoxy-L-arabinose transferase-like glycosyltransferase